MPAITNFDTTVVVSFDRPIHSANIKTAHLGFSVVWDGINRFNQAPHLVEVKFNKAAFVDERTLVLKTDFKDTSIDYDLGSFRNAKNPRLRYVRSLGNIYGALPKDIMNDFEITLNVTDLTYFPNVEHHEVVRPMLNVKSPDPEIVLQVIVTHNISSESENVKPKVNSNSPTVSFVLDIVGDIKP